MSLTLTVFIILVVLGGLGLIGATIIIQPIRESLVASTNLSKIVDGDLLNIEIDQTTYAAVKAAEDRIKNT